MDAPSDTPPTTPPTTAAWTSTATLAVPDDGHRNPASWLAWVRETDRAVHRIGGAWFFAPQVAEVGAAVGIDDRFAFYAAGRGGVLGDPTGEVVASSFAFFPPQMVMSKYAEGVAGLAPGEASEAYARGLAAWAEHTFAEHADWDRLATLARRVADQVAAMCLPLFVGWRRLAQPQHPAARMAMSLVVLRELRGDRHVQAVAASGMTAVEAIVGGDGPERAVALRHPEPHPSVDAVRERREQVEWRTDELMAPAWAVLDVAERDDVTRLLGEAESVLDVVGEHGVASTRG